MEAFIGPKGKTQHNMQLVNLALAKKYAGRGEERSEEKENPAAQLKEHLVEYVADNSHFNDVMRHTWRK
jgi:hypothetical protein